MYRTMLFHLGRLLCFSMAAPSTTVFSNNKNNVIPRMAYIPLALKLSTLAYACSSWTKASLILQQQFQIVTTNNTLSENEKKIVSGLHISMAYLLLRFFHQKGFSNSSPQNVKKILKYEIFSSKLLIPLFIGLVICTIIEEAGLLVLLQLTSGSRRVYAISGRNSIKVEKSNDDIIENVNPKKINSEEYNNTSQTMLQVANINDSQEIQDSSENKNEKENNKKDNKNNNCNETINNDDDNNDNNNENDIKKENEISKLETTQPKKYYHDDCCICLGSCSYPQMESFCVVESHVAHTQCMLNWLRASKLKQQCPLCRQPLQVFIMSESMHDYIYGYPTISQFIQRNADWKCFLKRTGITLSITASLLLIQQIKILIDKCKYHNLQYSSSK